MRPALLAMTLAGAVALGGCAADDTTISMSFARRSFYDAPFPSDDLRRADGTVDVTKIPNPNHVDFIDQALALIARDARGFSLAGGIFFRASGLLDPATLPDVDHSIAGDAAVFLVGLDASQPDFLRRVPLDVSFSADGGPFGDRNLLALLPIQGIPLRSRTRYAAVVTRAVRDAHHRPLGRAAAPLALAEYRDALTTLAPLVAAADVAALAVFTTDDPTAAVGVVRDDALAAHPLVPPATAPTLATVYPDYCVYSATVGTPVYQSGTPPYQTSGGAWLFDAGGRPQFDHTETARIVFTIPRRAMPAAGWPTVIFVRTGAGGDNPLAERGHSSTPGFGQPDTPGTGPAMQLARVGFAGVQIDGPLGGLRNLTNGDEDFLIFNVLNASALRDNVRQSAMELSLLARALPSLALDTSSCPGATASAKFDGAHVALMGHSMGAWIAPLTLAFEPRIGAAVLSGAGGSYIANVMDKIKPLHVRPYAEILLDYNMDQRELSAHDPALTLLQWAVEPSDPQVYARRIVREPVTGESARHILMEQGIVDHYILPSIANSLSLSLGLDAGGPLYDADNVEEQSLLQPALASRLPLIGARTLALPVAGNVAGATALVVQHPGDAVEDGHEVLFQTEPPQHQYRCFLSSFALGTPSVPADAPADAPCQ